MSGKHATGAKTSLSEAQQKWAAIVNILILKPRHRWFSASSRYSQEWDGPHKTIGDAVIALLAEGHGEELPVYVAQGRKRTAQEIKECGGGYDWEVESRNAPAITIPQQEASK